MCYNRCALQQQGSVTSATSWLGTKRHCVCRLTTAYTQHADSQEHRVCACVWRCWWAPKVAQRLFWTPRR